MSRPVWTDDRWHVDGKGIHAGEYMLLWTGDGEPKEDVGPGGWVLVRIESRDRGQELHAYLVVGRFAFIRELTTEEHLRWPEPEDVARFARALR